ncbi:MAG: NAD(P)H-binding protein [Bdellovibrionales bacterium]|nr:NAD(P)H-binding protein [Bdellovibrionales bacterium]
MAKIAVAGAAGFVGRELIAALAGEHHVLALTRGRSRVSTIDRGRGLEWRQCDLFSLLETERALEGAECAVYLVHSMLPSAELTQASFADLDLLVADNFARAARDAGVRHIVYLGGILPQGETLSPHLASRQEVEQALASYGVPVTTLRAAMVLGPGGSSFSIVQRLVERLPWMICPAWTQVKSQPVALDDVVQAIRFVLGNAEHYHRVYDVAGPEAVTYHELMLMTADVLGLRRRLWNVPFFTPRLSRLWVTLVTGAPKNLIAPLIESLRHEMVSQAEQRLVLPGHRYASVREALMRATAERRPSAPRAFQLPDDERRSQTVRSVQRLPLPQHLDAEQVAQLYMTWVPKHLRPIIRVTVSGDRCFFRLPGIARPLLVIERSGERSSASRQLFYIRGGMLARPERRARLEFRETLDRKMLLAALHDFKPTLPWFLYIRTQAVVHLWVMRSFARFLLQSGKDEQTQ